MWCRPGDVLSLLGSNERLGQLDRMLKKAGIAPYPPRKHFRRRKAVASRRRRVPAVGICADLGGFNPLIRKNLYRLLATGD